MSCAYLICCEFLGVGKKLISVSCRDGSSRGLWGRVINLPSAPRPNVEMIDVHSVNPKWSFGYFEVLSHNLEVFNR